MAFGSSLGHQCLRVTGRSVNKKKETLNSFQGFCKIKERPSLKL